MEEIKKPRTEFEIFGYFKEIWVAGKFIGTIQSEKDREIFGYYGQKIETTKEKIVCENGKIVKPNTEIKTMLFPLCGRIKE